MSKPKRNLKPWSDAELRRMRRLAMRGKSTREAAEALKRTPGATRYKAHVAGISFRELRAA